MKSFFDKSEDNSINIEAEELRLVSQSFISMAMQEFTARGYNIREIADIISETLHECKKEKLSEIV